MADIIRCEKVTKRYKDVCALHQVNLAVPDDGGIVGLLGPNGSGKTTLIKLLTGLLTPTEGSVSVGGYEVGVETKAMVSYLSDGYALNESYTVAQQVEYYEDFFADFDKEKAMKMIAELGVPSRQKIKTLSKGTKEKLALILTLSRNAKVFILDEPIAGVDPAARDYILGTILAHKSANSTMIISTHLIAEIEEYFDFVIFLKQGQIVLQGKTQEIREREGKTIDSLFREVFKWM